MRRSRSHPGHGGTSLHDAIPGSGLCGESEDTSEGVVVWVLDGLGWSWMVLVELPILDSWFVDLYSSR